ncbi:MAG: Sir2 family NAD-dependent protein deacetylase [Pseudomonadales bacterium]|nr:Sir2 family NAD-dependent protein deacetylase [Pseudomonadales bacterium]
MKSNIKQEEVELFAQWILESKRTVVFTGAGISTESGIPDFRSPGGYWTKNTPIDFNDYIHSEELRKVAWKRKFESSLNIEGAEPNIGHQIISTWYNQSLVGSVITQNIDNLHQKSGIDEKDVIELHGNASYAKCLRCSRIYQFSEIEPDYHRTGTVSPCSQQLGEEICSGIIKTATISFGQSMPEKEMARANEETSSCGLFIVLGSSLVVYPAASFPEMAKKQGAKLIILNREPTGLDDDADLVLNSEIGETLNSVNELVAVPIVSS